ncbi:MAG TPA: 4Fe-4S binding protein [Sedimentisphaerales bacterium]|nr:4Fe-4S binding protein [Sedimentisphaerales bacterium]
MKFARGLLIFSYGLFTIAAQTLLFREFITTFEGNDISVGIFFGSWFLWVGLGAMLVYRTTAFAEKLLRNIELLFLAYLPAFILQLVLILQARELAGVESYARLPISTILVLSLVLNAPVSIITGILFTVACRWVVQEGGLAVSRVYVLEAAGSFMGGLGAAVLLGFGVTLARIFFILCFVVVLSGFCVQLAGGFNRAAGRRVFYALMTFALFCPAIGADKVLMHYAGFAQWPGADEALMRRLRIVKWARLLPQDALQGSFQTAQAEYLYGVYQGQWVAVREGSACEALPDHESAGRIAAIGLCQNPRAARILVIGSGLGLCYEFLRLPQIENVTWAHCDSEYVQEVEKFIPAELRIKDPRFHKLAGDVRTLLDEEKQHYDLVILDLPEATSSVLNRYYTLEFYRQVQESLRPGGVFGVRVAGGENIMGTELINLGASTKLTLEKAFSHLVLTPGEDTWFIASDSKDLTGDPGTLRDRYAGIESGAEVFPPDALLSVYLPDRADKAFKSYATADLPEGLLVNLDSRPLTHLYSLLLAAKQSGAPVARFIKHLALAGPPAFLVPIFLVIILRLFYVLKARGQGRPSSFDSTFLVFSAGWIGIGVVIVLMYLYQTRFGSLYLHIGVISSLFMVGLTAGALLTSGLLARQSKTRPQILLFVVILLHTLILAAAAFWPVEQWSHLTFGAAFVLCGLCTGCYFPLAARQLADSAFETGHAGSRLETADHLGASIGGVLTSLAIVPVLGTKLTLFVFVLLILANMPPAALRILKLKESFFPAPAGFNYRGLGYTLFGIGLSVVLCSNLLAAAGARLSPSLPQYAAQSLAGDAQIEPGSATVNGKTAKYFKVYDSQQTDPNAYPSQSQTRKLTGYVFSTDDLAPQVRGFGGRINLGVYIDTAGELINFHIIRSNETPAYLDLLASWQDGLKGRQLFRPQPFADVHAVTGATISSEAIVSALEKSACTFGTHVLGQTLEPGTLEQVSRARHIPDTVGMYLISALILTLIVTYRGGFWSRLAVLLYNLVACGLILNAQYSTEQIATVLSFHTPAIMLSGAFLLAIGVPLLVLMFGNIYCGYICPFGAAQELLGLVIPRRFRRPPSREKMQKARFVKYVVLLLLIIVFFFSRSRTTLAADPLISVFSLRFSNYALQSAVPWIVGIALLGSIFYTRFWCRYLCPVGAFLSLFNNVVLFKRILPVKKYGRCEFGLTAKDQMDCIYCDKCRYEAKPMGKPATRTAGKQEPLSDSSDRPLSRCLVAAAVAAAIFVSAASVDKFLQGLPAGLDYSAAFVASGGQPRDVDLQRIRTMVRQNKLADREADFYKKLENGTDAKPAPEYKPAPSESGFLTGPAETSPPKATDNPQNNR